MNITFPLDKCLFTDLPISNFDRGAGYVWKYTINMVHASCTIAISDTEFSKIRELLKTKKWILKGLLFNQIWHNEQLTTTEVLSSLIDSNQSIIPYTPKEKKDKILYYFFNRQSYDGERIIIPELIKRGDNPVFWEYLFFKNQAEFDFYLLLLKEEQLLHVNYVIHSTKGQYPSDYNLTAKGIDYVIKLSEGIYSKDCFVAMAFNNEMDKIYDSIVKPAVEGTGFKPIRIDREHLASDTTINDGIIAAIKKARFTIADFTDNRNGVYFEAGFALGRGQKVIYTCKESDLSNLHFDIRAYQQIIWKDAEDFKQKLIDKIEAFIK